MAKQNINGLQVDIYKHSNGTAYGMCLVPIEDVEKLKEYCEDAYNNVENHFHIALDNICTGFFFCN